ncbi:MAG TPA: anti-sigma regulatory factor [Mycobacteriales bacterium]|nr:anti-sigma regulatory factor [Mycobacteriales bacterium]
MTDESATARKGDVVEIRVPAEAAYVSLLRSAAAGLAARLDFTVDEIDDLRIAVDEACALVLPGVRADSLLTCRMTLGVADLRVAVNAETTASSPPEPTSFAWMVLTALADDVTVNTDHDHQITVSLGKARSASP